MGGKPPPPFEHASSELERQMKVMREVMARREEALRQLAMADALMDEDRTLLNRLSKS